jgi:hypothetical protein
VEIWLRSKTDGSVLQAVEMKFFLDIKKQIKFNKVQNPVHKEEL